MGKQISIQKLYGFYGPQEFMEISAKNFRKCHDRMLNSHNIAM